MSKYGHKTHNWFEAIVNKMGGEPEAERFLRGELTIVPALAKHWPVWKTVHLGLYKSAQEYMEALKSSKIQIIQESEVILSKISISQERRDADLVCICPADLMLGGRDQEVLLSDFFAKALGLGFQLCPIEVGPALILEYWKDITRVFVASEGILGDTVSDGKLGFRLDYLPDTFIPAIGTCGIGNTDSWSVTRYKTFVFMKPRE